MKREDETKPPRATENWGVQSSLEIEKPLIPPAFSKSLSSAQKKKKKRRFWADLLHSCRSNKAGLLHIQVLVIFPLGRNWDWSLTCFCFLFVASHFHEMFSFQVGFIEGNGTRTGVFPSNFVQPLQDWVDPDWSSLKILRQHDLLWRWTRCGGLLDLHRSWSSMGCHFLIRFHENVARKKWWNLAFEAHFCRQKGEGPRTKDIHVNMTRWATFCPFNHGGGEVVCDIHCVMWRLYSLPSDLIQCVLCPLWAVEEWIQVLKCTTWFYATLSFHVNSHEGAEVFRK